MNCPICDHNNPDNIDKCENCGKKLKTACPKCKTVNSINSAKCINCNFRLIYPCPSCKQNYQISSKHCSNCGFEMLRPCPVCKAINPYTRAKCSKCNVDLPQKNESVQEAEKAPIQQQIAETEEIKNTEYPVLTTELVNIDSIKGRIKNTVVVGKILNGFYKIIGLNADISGSVAKKLKENIVAFSFNDYGDNETSCVSSIYTALKITSDIKEYNAKIKDKVKISLEIKIGISMQSSLEKLYFAEIERTLAEPKDIVVDAEIYKSVCDSFEFEILESDENKQFYRLKPLEEITTQEAIIPVNQIEAEPVVEEPPVILQEEEIVEESFPVEQQQELIESTEEIPYESVSLEEMNAPENNLSEQETVQEEALVKPATDVDLKNERELNSEKAFAFLSNIICKADNGFVIQVSAPNGAGKSTLINSVKNSLDQEKILWLTAQCQPFNQIVPFGLIRDLFKNLFDIPSQIINPEETKNNIINSLVNIMGINDKSIETLIINLILSESNCENRDITTNLSQFYETIESMFNSICSKLKCVLVIEDFEYIDKSSLDCIKYLIKQGLLNHKLQIVINHIPEINTREQLMNLGIDNRIFTIKLLPLQNEEILKAMTAMLNGQDIIPTKLKSRIVEKSKGLPLYVEQVFWILYNSAAIIRDGDLYKFNPEASAIDLPDSIEELLQIRLSQINTLSPSAFNILLATSLFGYKFLHSFAQNLINIKPEEFAHLFQTLGSMGIYVQADKNNIGFKHKLIWDACYQALMSSPQKSEYYNQAYNLLKNHTKSPAAMLALVAENANQSGEALNQWNVSSQESILLGDVETYIHSQHRVLALIDVLNIPEKEAVKNNIFEQLGIMNYEIKPEEASKYLSNVIIQAEKDNNIAKIIDLSGYLSRSCELLGNYAGSVECSDKALSLINKQEMPLEFALLSYSKLEALVNLGKLEEAIILASHDVLPILVNAFENKETLADLSTKELAFIMLETELLLAKALVFQGNKAALYTLQSVASKAVDLEMINIEAEARLVESIFKTIQGDTKSTTAMLEYLKTIIPKVKNKSSIKLYWSISNLLLKLIDGNADEVNNIAFTVLAIAQEIKDYNIQALAKYVIGKLLKDARTFDNANTMYNDTIQYSSEYRLATAALVGWYLIADIRLTQGDFENGITIALKALDIASKPNINNHLFKALLSKVIAEIYIAKGDFENFKIYIEQAIDIAITMELYFLVTKLYETYGKAYQEFAVTLKDDRKINAANAHSLYVLALQNAEKIDNEKLITEVNKDITDLDTFCQLSGIQI